MSEWNPWGRVEMSYGSSIGRWPAKMEQRMSEPNVEEIVANFESAHGHGKCSDLEWCLANKKVRLIISSWRAQKAALAEARFYVKGYLTPHAEGWIEEKARVLASVDAALNPQPAPNAVHGQDGET